MICAKIKPKASLVLEKKIFKGFYYIWAWRPSWSMDRDYFSNLSFSLAKEAPHEILRSFEILNSFPIQMYGTHTNALRSKLDLAVKRSNVNAQQLF